MLEEMLIKEGYAVLRAYSGTEALLLLREDKPDLVLLDLMLPGLGGEEVLPHFRDIPVIVVSAKSDVEDKVELLLGGAVDYVTKPFSGKELMARIAVRLSENKITCDTNALNDFESASILEKAQVSHLRGKLREAEIYNDTHVTKLVCALADAGCEVLSIQEREESLESYYIRLIGGGRYEQTV